MSAAQGQGNLVAGQTNSRAEVRVSVQAAAGLAQQRAAGAVRGGEGECGGRA